MFHDNKANATLCAHWQLLHVILTIKNEEQFRGGEKQNRDINRFGVCDCKQRYVLLYVTTYNKRRHPYLC